MSYNSELQALRELALFTLPQLRCAFCSKPFMSYQDAQAQGFGHRRHRAVRVKFTMHHADENRDNNDLRSNIRIAHPWCHREHHIKQLAKKGAHYASRIGEKAEEGRETQRS